MKKALPHQVGATYEQQACTFLQQQGLRLLVRNYRCRLGEIDLVMRDATAIIFVEVRYRHSHLFGSGIESIEFHKCKKLIRTAEFYLQKNKLTEKVSCRFDVVGVTNNALNSQFTWIKDAFQA